MKRIFVSFFIFAVLTSGIAWGLPASAAELPVGCAAYDRDLTIGGKGEDVRSLQQFLNAKGFSVSASGPGAVGKETAYFGRATKTALAKFQKANSIAPALGYFGPLTRAEILKICAKGAVAPTPPVAIGTTLPPPVVAPVATSTPPVTTSTTAAINPRSIVGVSCYYRTPDDDLTVVKGTGVIVHPDGYVLTAKHAVDPRWTSQMYQDTLSPQQKEFYGTALLDYCAIGIPEDTTPLPTAEEVRNGAAARQITRHFQYLAEPYFLPDRTGLSDAEFKSADFAILRISKTNTDCALYNKYCTEFGNFPYSLTGQITPLSSSDPVVSFGYPGVDGRISTAFYDFYLTGTEGIVAYYLTGNQRFSDKYFTFSFRGGNIRVGRSGSPLYFKDRIVGMLYGSVADNESYNLTITAIRGILDDHGLGWILKGE